MLHLTRDRSSYIILEGQHIIHPALEAATPQMSIVCRIDQLHRDFQTVIDSLHGAFEYGGDTKFLGDLGHPACDL